MTYLTDTMADIIQDADIPDATARALLLAAICESAPTPAGYSPLVKQIRGEIERLEAHRDKARARVQKYRQLRAGTQDDASDTKALQGVTSALQPVTVACISTSTSTDTSTDTGNNNIRPNKKGADIPECLATVDGFADAFAAWVEFRAAKRAKATERVKATILKRLSERPEQAVAALDTCMAAGWTDVRWDWIDNRNRATAHTGDPRNAKPGGFYDSGSQEDAWPEMTAAERRAAEIEGKAK